VVDKSNGITAKISDYFMKSGRTSTYNAIQFEKKAYKITFKMMYDNLSFS